MNSDDMMNALKHERWTKVCFRNEAEVVGLAYIDFREEYADVFALHGDNTANAYRANLKLTADGETSAFQPSSVAWACVGQSEVVFSALLDLPKPTPGAPVIELRDNKNGCIPEEWMRLHFEFLSSPK
ncbi:hypothetical protein AB5J62_26185 [Amycolatopsis sp. cg5]|uniref:hypothetical protein n=1 Tax=Amycolatopsis sp. cg5 TaxID=3238802 RepID=UPI0035237EAF